MARKVNPHNIQVIRQTVQENDGNLNAAGVAKKTGLHPQAVIRLLASTEDEPEKSFYEDDKGFLSIFRKRK